MSEVSERYARLADAFSTKLAAVPEGDWDKQTPCVDWNVRALVDHVVGTQGMFVGFIGEQLGDIPTTDADPAGAWKAASTRVQALVDDPATASSEFDGFTGRTSFEAAVDKFLTVDLVVHGWDLARATGQDEGIDPAEVARVRAIAESYGDAMRGPQVFGPALDAPEGADEQAKLLAFLGRQP